MRFSSHRPDGGGAPPPRNPGHPHRVVRSHWDGRQIPGTCRHTVGAQALPCADEPTQSCCRCHRDRARLEWAPSPWLVQRSLLIARGGTPHDTGTSKPPARCRSQHGTREGLGAVPVTEWLARKHLGTRCMGRAMSHPHRGACRVNAQSLEALAGFRHSGRPHSKHDCMLE